MKIFLNKIRQIVRGKLEIKRESTNSYKPPFGFSIPEIPLRKDIHPRDYSSISSFLNEKSPSFSCPVCGFNRLFASTLNCGYVMSFDYLTIIANMENNNE